MRLERSELAWLVASMISGALTFFAATASGDDPISAGMLYFATRGLATITAIAVTGLALTEDQPAVRCVSGKKHLTA